MSEKILPFHCSFRRRLHSVVQNHLKSIKQHKSYGLEKLLRVKKQQLT